MSNTAASDPRIRVAIISNSQTPYRLALHKRIVAEIPEIKLFSLFTHEVSNAPWQLKSPPEIGPVSFGEGEDSAAASRWSGAMREWKKGGAIIRCLKEQHIQSVVIGGYNDPGRLRIIRWCYQNGTPCFVFGDSNIRGDSASGLKAKVKQTLLRWISSRVSGFFACGTLGRAYFEKYGAKADRIFYFPYEPDYRQIEQLPLQAVDAARQKFGIHGGRWMVYSGRLAPEKRVDLLIEAFNAIHKDRPDWKLLVIGDGPLRDSLKSRQTPQAAAQTLWTGFLKEQEEISALYRLSDVLVLPSDHEPWAVVINEAAAAGLAIVASDAVGAAAELVKDGVNGRIFPRGNADSLRQALLEVTAMNQVESMKRSSETILSEWRKKGDPVVGLRRALSSAGLISNGLSAHITQ